MFEKYLNVTVLFLVPFHYENYYVNFLFSDNIVIYKNNTLLGEIDQIVRNVVSQYNVE